MGRILALITAPGDGKERVPDMISGLTRRLGIRRWKLVKETEYRWRCELRFKWIPLKWWK